jgi:gamma-glutamylcyclotransferase (GGCT)/AIG2-like uncharacterized protein YtfP
MSVEHYHIDSNMSAEQHHQDKKDIRQVFVYGTLREYGSNRHWVNKYLQTCTRKCYFEGATMYHYDPQNRGGSLGAPYGYPYVVERGSDNIIGEILTFTDWEAALDQLDRIEGYPAFYDRRVKTVTLEDGRKVEAWVYFMQPSQVRQGRAIPTGDWIQDGN